MTLKWTLCSATLGDRRKYEPPLGPLYIATVLRNEGVDVDFRDYQLCPFANWWCGKTLADSLDGHARTLAVSCFADMLPVVIDATRRLKERDPNVFILLGGPGPSGPALELMHLFPWVDGVVRGEGEHTATDWVTALKNGAVGRPVIGMVYRHGKELIDGGVRPRIENLGCVHEPAYELLDWDHYTHARVITARGCAYRCCFCDVSALWGGRAIYRGVTEAVSEIERIRDRYGMKNVGIADDTFVQKPARVAEFSRCLLTRNSGIEWGCFGRISLMSPRLVELMARSGCRTVFYGIDSGSQRILDATCKVTNAQDVARVVEYSAQAFDKVEASFIWGYPTETLEDFRQTIDLAAQISASAPKVNVQLHMLSPLPNSPICKSYRRHLNGPEEEDRRWLLLPPVLLDDRATCVRKIVQTAPHVFPGFHTLPTPDKHAKLKLLDRIMRSLDRTIGNTLLDARTSRLLRSGDRVVEGELMAAEKHPADRIGVGLAIGFLRRSRRRVGIEKRQPFDQRSDNAPLRRHDNV